MQKNAKITAWNNIVIIFIQLNFKAKKRWKRFFFKFNDFFKNTFYAVPTEKLIVWLNFIDVENDQMLVKLVKHNFMLKPQNEITSAVCKNRT